MNECMAEYKYECIAYITLKDHKDNFRSAHPCRLINPAKAKLGRSVKQF